MKWWFVIPLLVGFGCLISTGCSGSNRPATAPVHGVVTFQGKPVAGASVTFLCPGAPRPAAGMTDETGNYRLTTFAENDGAIVGNHVVTVKKLRSAPPASLPTVSPNAGPSEINKAIEAEAAESYRQQRKAEKSGATLPAKYASRETSDLRKEVVDGENVINLELAN
jgi:hypothetical protein